MAARSTRWPPACCRSPSGRRRKPCPMSWTAPSCTISRLRFGEARDTDDADGQVTETSDVRPTDEQIRAALPALHAATSCRCRRSIPPIKVAGERAYDLARAGAPPVLEPRPARVDRFELIGRPDADTRGLRGAVGQGRLHAQPGARPRAGLRHAGPYRRPAPPAGRPLHGGAGDSAGQTAARGGYPAALPRTSCCPSRPRWPTSRRWP